MTNQNKKPYDIDVAKDRADKLNEAFWREKVEADKRGEQPSLKAFERFAVGKTLEAACNISVASFYPDPECHKWINRRIGWLVGKADRLLGYRKSGTDYGRTIHPDTLEKWHVEIRQHEWA